MLFMLRVIPRSLRSVFTCFPLGSPRRRIRQKLQLGGLLASVFLLGACNSVNTVERVQPQAIPDVVDFKRVISNPALQQIVSVVSVNEGTVSGDLMKVQVGLENKTYDYQNFSYEFVWFMKDGMQVKTPPSLWKPGQIQGRETIYISGIAPNPRVVDFQLNLLESE